MSNQLEVGQELQNLMSHITNGQSHLEHLRNALSVPLLEKWRLNTYRDIPETRQGSTLFAWAIQNKNKTALELLMQNFRLELLPDDPPEHPEQKQKSSLLYIAVEYYDEPTWAFVLERIDIKRVCVPLGKGKTTVLHAAANRNVADIFRALHRRFRSTLGDKLLEIRDGSGQTVLHVAASRSRYDEGAEQRCYDTVTELLKIQPELIKVQDNNHETVFHKAVIANQKNVLQHLLAVDATMLSKCDKNKNSAYVTFLRKRGNRDHVQTKSRNDIQILEGLSRTPTFSEEIGSILHKAILELDKDYSTLRQLLFKDEPGGFGPELNWDLSAFDNGSLSFTEYLHVLESEKFNISFYETLIRVALPDLSCTKDRACDATSRGLRKSSEASVIFSHLGSKGVKHIIEAVVPDCMVHPHANRHIINALRPFNIRRLKWRRLDLGVTTIAMAAPEVEVLTLYSSGDRDALSQWLHTINITIFRGEDDDAELEKTRRQCEETLLSHKKHEQHDCTLRVVRDDGLMKMKQLPCDCRELRFLGSQIKVELEPVLVPSHKPDEQMPLYQFQIGQGTIFDKLSPLRNSISGLAGLKDDSRTDRNYLKENPVKIAVLDSGIYADSGLFPTMIGASFIEDMTTTDSHWHTATNPHGTIMGSLIRKLDPTCKILAARTHHGPDMQGGDVGTCIKALKWAVSHKADVICISWTCAEDLDDKDSGDLETEIQEAAKNSLIFCATGDKGPTAKESYPAGFKTPFKICSCSISGQPSNNAETKNAEFYLPAEDLNVAIPKYLNQGDKGAADGSSAATAIAAGLATLLLSLARFAYYRLEDGYSISEADDQDNSGIMDDYPDRWGRAEVQRAEDQVANLKKRSVMERVFKHMCCGAEKFVQPWGVFPNDLVGVDFEKAKRSVADFLDRASKR